MLAWGAYIGFTTSSYVGFFGGLPLAFLTTAAVGAGVEVGFVRRLYDEKGIYTLLLLLGVSLALTQTIRWVWGVSSRAYKIPALLAGRVGGTLPVLGSIHISSYMLILPVFAALIYGGVWLLLTKTNIGIILRASLENRELVRGLGINLYPVYTLIFTIGAGIAGLAGFLLAPLTGVFPAMGMRYLLLAFVTVVIGGMGSFRGSLYAGLLIGVASMVTSVWYSEMSYAIIFVLMIIFLIIKPEGISQKL